MAKVTRLATAVKAKVVDDGKPTKIVITPPRFQYADIKIEGTAPYMSNAMSSEARQKMRDNQEAGTANRSMKRSRPPKDFEAQFKGSLHMSQEGWYGIPCSSMRTSLIKACINVGFSMNRAKGVVFVEPDGFDRATGDPLIRIHSDAPPVRDERIGKLSTGVSDILTRGRFDKWWAKVTIKWDADVLSPTDIMNLVARAGIHVGVGAGRPGSTNSAGIGMGTFKVVN